MKVQMLCLLVAATVPALAAEVSDYTVVLEPGNAEEFRKVLESITDKLNEGVRPHARR